MTTIYVLLEPGGYEEPDEVLGAFTTAKAAGEVWAELNHSSLILKEVDLMEDPGKPTLIYRREFIYKRPKLQDTLTTSKTYSWLSNAPEFDVSHTYFTSLNQEEQLDFLHKHQGYIALLTVEGSDPLKVKATFDKESAVIAERFEVLDDKYYLAYGSRLLFNTVGLVLQP